MISDREMVEVFGKENLVYARPERLYNISISNENREFILNTGFPKVVSFFRFSMDFEPISEDIQIGKYTHKFRQLYTIGCKAETQLIGRIIQLSKIGLGNNASLSEIGKKIKIWGADNYFIFDAEVTQAYRICLNLDNNGEIIYINPENLSWGFFNSSIQQLAASTAAYNKNILTNESEAENLEEPNFENKMKNFEEELKIIDPKALENEENLWVRAIKDADAGY